MALRIYVERSPPPDETVIATPRERLALVNLPVVEQCLDAVRAVLAGADVTERCGVRVHRPKET